MCDELPTDRSNPTMLFTLETVRQDLAYGCRLLCRHPLFTTFAVLTLAVGLGANTVVFSVIETLLLRPLPFPDSSRLVWIENSSAASEGIPFLTGQANYRDWCAMNRCSEGLGAYVPSLSERGGFILNGNGDPIELHAACVSGNLLGVLGIQPNIGREFSEEECHRAGPHAVMLTETFWSRQYGGDRRVVGSTIQISGVAHIVVGVLPNGFETAFSSVFRSGAGIVDIVLPFRSAPGYDNWGNMLAVVGKLKPNTRLDQAQAEIDVLNDQLRTAHPERGQFAAHLLALQGHVTHSYRRSLWLLAVAAAVVLLIICVNLSSLVLARSASREHEISVRLALGAQRSRLVRQILSETVLLSMIGGLAGLAVAFLATSAIAKRHAELVPLLHSVKIDMLALSIMALLALSAGLFVGIVPALTLSKHELKEAGRASTPGVKRMRIHESLVVAEVALAFVLMVGAGLFIRSFLRLLEVDPGFRAEHVLACSIQTHRQFPSQAASVVFYQGLLNKVRQIPGIDAATLPDKLPLALNDLVRAHPKEDLRRPADMPSVLAQLVDESYFKTLLVPLRVGRPFETHDAQFDWQGTNQQVAIVNQKMAAEFWGNENVVGKVLVLESQPNAAVELQIVGVCGNVRQSALDQDAGPEVYLVGREHGVLVIRAGAPLAAMASQIRDVLHQIDPYMAVGEFTPLTRVLNKALAPKLVITSCLGSFSLVALGLAAIGIFGVTAYSTSQRTKEIGIRMALGATPGAVVRLIVRRGCSQVWTGCMIGLVAALACAHAVRSFLFEVSPVDPFTLASSCVLVILTGFVAGWLPARKASGMNPLIAIRKD